MSATDRPVVVTGASGFIGSRLVEIIGPDRSRLLVRKAVPWLPGGQLETDLLDPTVDLAGMVEGAAAVVHLAGVNEVVASTEPDRALADSVVMTRRVADAAVRARVPRLVYVSTVHVYGAQMAPGARLDESVVPEPRSAYAVSRLASEHLASAAAGGGVSASVLRLTNAVGAPADPAVDRWTLVAADLCREAALHGTLTLRSSGQQWRDFVSLTDVCRTLASIVDASRDLTGTFNLGSGRSTTVRALAELIADRFEARTGKEAVLHVPGRTMPDAAPYEVVTEGLADAGWRLDTPLVEAVDELIDFCVTNRDSLGEVVA